MSRPQNGDEINNHPAALADADEDDSSDDDNHEDDETNSDSDDEGDDDDNPLLHLPPYVIRRVEKLNELQESHESIMKDYLRERAALEKKYEALLQPLYQERAAVVRGDRDAAMIAAENENENADLVKGIPQFFATAMAHMDAIGELICEDDVDCLEHLSDITCVDREDGMGFCLTFSFKPNDYFTNTTLSKQYIVPNLLCSDEPLLKSIEGTTINWKPGRCLTHRTIQKKQRGKGKNAGKVRTVTKQEEKESFFHWFKAPEMPPMDTMDEEEAEKVEELFDNDYEVACAFRTHIIPNAVKWFTGKVSAENQIWRTDEFTMNIHVTQPFLSAIQYV